MTKYRNTTTNRLNNIKDIHIIGRRWFDRINGNTYFSSEAFINGDRVASIDYEYGYGDQYIDSIAQNMEKDGNLPELEHYENGGDERIWRYCDRNKIKFNYSVSDVSRKKDL